MRTRKLLERLRQKNMYAKKKKDERERERNIISLEARTFHS